MPSSCKEIRALLAQCLQESDCVMVSRHTAAECLRSPLAEQLPPKCLQLKRGYGECRRGFVDMRKRFRGNFPVSAATLQETDATGEGYQLYAGSSAFASGAARAPDPSASSSSSSSAAAAAEVGGGKQQPPRDWRDEENEKYRKEMREVEEKAKALQQQQQQQQQQQEQQAAREASNRGVLDKFRKK